MFDFTTNTAPTQIIIPSLYSPPSFSFDAGKEFEKGWLSHKHLIQDDNTNPTITTIADSYAYSQPHHRRQRSYALSIGIGHPPAMKNPVQPSRLSRERPPLSIRIPNVTSLNPIRQRIFNTSRPSSPVSSISTCRSMPSLQAVSDWVASSQRRARDTREQRSKIVAARILALNSPKPIRIRFPPSETPRPYVKSSLSQSFSLDS